MATSEIRLKQDARAPMTITLANLATLTGRQSTLVANANARPAALVAVVLQSGGVAPMPGGAYDVYLLRSDGVSGDDSAAPADAAITIENAPKLGSLSVTPDANKTFSKVFDTSDHGPLGSSWGIAIVNRTDQAINAAGNSVAYSYLVAEAQ